jgi:hypothetical protein
MSGKGGVFAGSEVDMSRKLEAGIHAVLCARDVFCRCRLFPEPVDCSDSFWGEVY